MIQELTTIDFDNTVSENQAVVVEFYTPTCAHCKKLVGAIEKLSEEIGDKAVFGKVNIEAESFLQSRFDITVVPTLIFFKKGDEVNKLVGEVHPLIIAEEIKKLQ